LAAGEIADISSNLTFGTGGKDKEGKAVAGWGYYEVRSFVRLSVILLHSINTRRSLEVRALDPAGMEQMAYILISQILELVTLKFLSGGILFWCTVSGYARDLQGLENGAVAKVFIARLNFWSPCKCQSFLRQANSLGFNEKLIMFFHHPSIEKNQATVWHGRWWFRLVGKEYMDQKITLRGWGHV